MSVDRYDSGICRICNGVVVANVVEVEVSHEHPSSIYGKRSRYGETVDGYYCRNCGIKYQFLTKKEKGGVLEKSEYGKKYL